MRQAHHSVPSTSWVSAPAPTPRSPPPAPRRADVPSSTPLLTRAVSAALAAIMAAATPSVALAAAPPSQPAFKLPTPPPTRAYTPPAPTVTMLKNGLRVFVLRDPDSGPTVRGALVMRGGQRASPPSALGVATLAASVQRTGGSTAHRGASLDALLDDLAASVEATASPDATSLSFECAAEDAGTVLSLVGELVKAPALPGDKLALAQAQVTNLLRHRDDDPAAVPPREAARRVYGRDSRFARSPTVEQVNAITRADLASYLAAWQRPDSAVLALVGDVGDARTATALAAAALRDWAPAHNQPATPPDLPSSPLAPASEWRGRKFLYDRPGAPQATVVLAAPGVSLTDPDVPALDVLALSLNGFGGALFDGVRSRAGLAYSVSAAWDTGSVDHAGLFAAGGATARPGPFLAALKTALKTARDNPPSGPALASAKAIALNRFVFNYSSADAVAYRAAGGALLGVPSDYLSKYRAALAALTDADVAAAAARHLKPDDAIVIVSADARSVRGELGGGWEALAVDPVETVKPMTRGGGGGGSGGGEDGGSATAP